MAAELPDPFEPPPDPPAAEPAAKKAGPVPQWQADAARAKQSGRATALIVTALLAVVVFGGLYVLLVVVPTKVRGPVVVSIPIPDLTDELKNFAPPKFTLEDARTVTGDWVPPEDADVTDQRAQAQKFFRQKLDNIRDLPNWWKSVRPDQAFDPGRRPVVVHVAGLAAVRDGVVYLLPSDARRDDPGSWVKAEEIVAAMDDCPAANKLLLLDLSRPTASPFLGPLANDAAEKLDKFLRAYKAKEGTTPAFVLTACAGGEVGLMMPVERTSAFAFYFAEAVAGKAAGYAKPSGREKGGNVSARDVGAFVAARVQRWARRTHGDKVTQTPQFYDRGRTDDFPLRLRDTYSTAPPPAPAADEPPPPPRQPADEPELPWENYPAPPPPAAVVRYRSLRSAAAELDKPQKTDPVKKLKEAADDYLPAEAARSEEKALGEKRDKFAKAAKAEGVTPDLVALLVWRWVLETAQPKADGRNTHERAFLAAAKALDAAGDRPFSTEVLLLQTVRGLEAKSTRSWVENPAAGAVKWQLVRAEAAAVECLAGGPDGFLWAKYEIDEADRKRREAESALNDPAGWTDAEFRRAAEKLDEARGLFGEAVERMAAAAAARREAAAGLERLAGTAYAAAEFDLPAVDGDGNWLALADAVLPLAKLVYQNPKPAADLPTEAIRDATKRAKVAREKFDRTWSWDEKRVKAKADPPPPNPRPEDLVWLRAAWAIPTPRLLAQKERDAIRNATRLAAAKLHQTVRDEDDRTEDDSKDQWTPPPRPALRAGGDPRRRAAVAVKLLELAGYAGGDEIRRQAEAAVRSEDWVAASAAVRAAWTDADKYRKLRTGSGPAAERAARAYPVGVGPVGEFKQSLRADEDGEFVKWLRDHYRAYATIRKAGTAENEDYRKAADDLDRGAGN